MSEDILKEAFGDLLDTIRNSYAMSVLNSLPDDDAKKLVMTFIKNGCPPRAALDSLLELSKEENKEKRDED